MDINSGLPLVSVIMSTYNETLEELTLSVNSILNQTYSNLEFIIVNDNPKRVDLCDFLNKLYDKRIKLLINKQNIGLVQSLNKAISAANGEYVARMDADDISTSNRIEMQLQYLKEKDLDLVGGKIDYIDEKGKPIEELGFRFLTEPDEICEKLLMENQIAHPTYFVKKEMYSVLNGYRNISWCEDYDFLLRANKMGFMLGNVPEICLHYRIRGKSITQLNAMDQAEVAAYLKRHYNEIFDITEENISDLLNNPIYRFRKTIVNMKKRIRDAIK